MSYKHVIGAGVALSALVPVVASSAAQSAVQATPVVAASAAESAPDPATVQTLVDALNAAIAALGPDAKVEDLEATMIFAVDQSQQSDAVIDAALDAVAAAGSPDVQTAAANVKALRKRSTGTGAIEQSGGGLGFDSLSFGPSLAVGGGTSDYTTAG